MAAAVVCTTGCEVTDSRDPVETTSEAAADVTEQEPNPAPTETAEPALLRITDQRDGDSWVASKSDCMTGYSPCLPIVDDLNCPEICHPVTVTGNDPYRLDRDGDGIGCDS